MKPNPPLHWHKDFFGNDLYRGQEVAYMSTSRTSSELRLGIIVGFTKHYVQVVDQTSACHEDIIRVSPYKVVLKRG